MASKYYTSTGKEVYDGDIVYADDLNSVNDAVDTALQAVEADIDAVGLNAPVILELAEAWAENPEDTQVEPGKYSALHWATKAAADAVLTAADRVQTGLDRTQTGSDRVQTTADRVQTVSDRTQTGLDRVATAADRVQTGLDAAATAADRVVVQSIADSISLVPVGAIMAYVPGYFTNNSNGGFVGVLGNTVASANSLLNPTGWYVCNGGQVNSPDSSIFNGAGRYLPNITDSRFLMGFTSAGSIGGSNTLDAHTHSASFSALTSGDTALSIAQIPSHNHSVSVSVSSGGAHTHSLNGGVTMSGSSLGSGGSRGDRSGTAESAGDHGHSASGSAGYTGSGATHNHSITIPTVTTTANSVAENRPVFLSCFYIMKVF